MHPPSTNSIQPRDEERPCGEASPSESTVHPCKENRMNPYILPIAVIAALSTVALILGLAAISSGSVLDMQLGEHRRIHIGPGEAKETE